jgi:molecular chaperone GrpE
MSQKNPATPETGAESATAPTAEVAPLPAPDLAAVEAELDKVRAEAAENLDRFLRAKAETENVRRRADTEVANAHKYAVERFAAEILAVKDSLELARAVELPQDSPVVQKVVEGLDLTLKLLDSVFQRFALTEVNPAKGEKFDPEKHQAMSVVESTEVPDNHVLTTVQKGYLLHGRVVRPAMVMVAKAPAEAGGKS